MKKHQNTSKTLFLFFTALLVFVFTSNDLSAQKRKKEKQVEHLIFQTNPNGNGIEMSIEFTKGSSHNHPLMAIWVEDMDGNYVQTLYVAQSIAKGYFSYGDKSTGRWKAGEISRPAALPYWAHKRNVKNDIGNYMPKPGFEVADAYTGATPKGNFNLETKTDKMISGKFRVLMEINQTWDWNSHWTNSKFPDDPEYRTSSQPALVYAADVDTDSTQKEYLLKVIGRSHHSGADGKLYSDLDTITTALEIVSEIKVVLK